MIGAGKACEPEDSGANLEEEEVETAVQRAALHSNPAVEALSE